MTTKTRGDLDAFVAAVAAKDSHRPDQPAGHLATHRSRGTADLALSWADDPTTLTAHHSLFSLFGPNGVLPASYIALATDNGGRDGEQAARFLDALSARVGQALLAAEAKNDLSLSFLWHRGKFTDTASRILSAAIGLDAETAERTNDTDGWLSISPAKLFDQAGALITGRSSAHVIQRLLQAILALPVTITDFVPVTTRLAPEDQLRLPSAGQPSGQNHQLGHDTILGDRITDTQGGVAITIACPDIDRFRALLPGESDFTTTLESLTLLLGCAQNVYLRLIYSAPTTPLERHSLSKAKVRLGRDAWLGRAVDEARRQPRYRLARQLHPVRFRQDDGTASQNPR